MLRLVNNIETRFQMKKQWIDHIGCIYMAMGLYVNAFEESSNWTPYDVKLSSWIPMHVYLLGPCKLKRNSST